MQQPKKQQQYSHLTPIMKTIQVRRTTHVGHCWKSRDKFISDILLWIPSHGWAKARQPERTYMQQFRADTGCGLEDLPEAMNHREGWRERFRRSTLVTQHDDDDIYIYIYIFSLCWLVNIGVFMYVSPQENLPNESVLTSAACTQHVLFI